jgi:hypothetical protein
MGIVPVYVYWALVSFPLNWLLINMMHIWGTTNVCVIKLRVLCSCDWYIAWQQTNDWCVDSISHIQLYRSLSTLGKVKVCQTRHRNTIPHMRHDLWLICHVHQSEKNFTFDLMGNIPNLLDWPSTFYWWSRIVWMSLLARIGDPAPRRARWHQFILVSPLWPCRLV